MATVGLALPAIRTAGGYFVSKNEYDTAWGDLIMALMTPAGGRPMQRSFGSSLYSLLFDPLDDVTQQMVTKTIASVASRWVPTVTINNVDIQAVKHGVSLKITFSLARDASALAIRTFIVSKSGTILSLQGVQQ